MQFARALQGKNTTAHETSYDRPSSDFADLCQKRDVSGIGVVVRADWSDNAVYIVIIVVVLNQIVIIVIVTDVIKIEILLLIFFITVLHSFLGRGTFLGRLWNWVSFFCFERLRALVLSATLGASRR
jgi:K+-sensing histidine kinase KdpD